MLSFHSWLSVEPSELGLWIGCHWSVWRITGVIWKPLPRCFFLFRAYWPWVCRQELLGTLTRCVLIILGFEALFLRIIYHRGGDTLALSHDSTLPKWSHDLLLCLDWCIVCRVHDLCVFWGLVLLLLCAYVCVGLRGLERRVPLLHQYKVSTHISMFNSAYTFVLVCLRCCCYHKWVSCGFPVVFCYLTMCLKPRGSCYIRIWV